jgi:Ni2+-binding GTPase involved in maturation of urease and hydrogenase
LGGLVNTIIISPRRWGKSTLVSHAAAVIKEETAIKVVHLDIFNIRNEQEFYHNLASEVLKVTANGWEELVNNVKKILTKASTKNIFFAR